ncbi:tetratricopeptide repeat protein [Kitasatospora sp. A2-31]|uniref:tetratricopeptide repeat protein n=1 Tax=Kitasatospora sp. A2-31 TaxID=2916414 RepID=UPI001EEBC56A|nr:tetratricopeptide repeat protein [Kitasatospora sp. A2-31]MCG6497815.1 tetratricopeptide repeat-containing serine protease family protein [Kitasatospora sp. A2-31]
MERDRVVAVEGPEDGYGSGYVVGRRLVLTSAHVVREAETVELYRPGGGATYRGRVVWRGRSGGRDDAALVEVTDERWCPPRSASTRWGRLATSLPAHPCETQGVPDAAQDDPEFNENRHLAGWINPGSGLVGNRYVMNLEGTPPGWVGRPGQPWGGLSGGVVVSGTMVIGVVVSESRHFGHGEVQVVPAYMLHRDDGFRAALKRYGADSLALEPAEFADLVGGEAVDVASPNGSPTALLQAERQVVGFHGRGPLLDELVTWCRQDGFGSWLLHGPGGQGKTRLVRELGRRLTAEPKPDDDPDRLPWTVVWLRPTVPLDEPSLKRLRETTGPLLVVLDYAEARVDQLALLLGTVRERQVPFKLVLIARTAGHWWKHARTAGGAAADLLRRAPVVELPPLAADKAERAALYRRAAEAFARNLPHVRGCSGPKWRDLAAGLPLPDLGRAGFDNVLTLHMTALADLLDEGMPATAGSASADPDDVETRLLVHESQYWRLTLKQGEEEPGYLAFKDALAAATLLGADDYERADAVLRRVPSLPDHLLDTVDGWIAKLYPPDGTGRRPWGSLQPDRLAERFVGEHVLERRRLVPALVEGIDRAEAERFLTLLARAAHHRPLRDRLAPLLAGLCGGHADVLALPAIAVATQVEEPEPILDGLRNLLDAPSTGAEDLAVWAAAVPDFSYNLGPWAVELLRRLVEIRRARGVGGPEETLALAGDLRDLSRNLNAVGAEAEALVHGDSAVELLRPLAQARGMEDPHGVRAWNGLAAGLNNRAAVLGKLGRRQDALEAAEEAVGIFRKLDTAGAAENPAHLLRSLATLAVRQGRLGFGREALATMEEVVARQRHLARAGDEEALADLALDLNNLAVCCSAEGRREGALERSQEAVELLRPLAERRPDAHRPQLAVVLGTLSSALGAMGRMQEALETIEEAMIIRRRLADRRPAEYGADLALGLNALAVRLRAVGRGSEALARIEESVVLYRELAAAGPVAHTQDLAMALHSQADELADAGDVEEALRVAEESAELYRRLDQDFPEAFAEDYAKVLSSLGSRLGTVGRVDEAVEALQLASRIYRSLSDGRADAVRPGLARCRDTLGTVLLAAGRTAEALAVVEEAVAVSRELAAANPAAFGLDLARALTHQSYCLRDLGRMEESVPLALEAVEAARSTAALPDSAFLLGLLSELLMLARRSTEALAAVAAIVSARRRLAELDPVRHGPSLIDTLQLFAIQLGRTGRLPQAMTATEELVGLRRRIWKETDTAAARIALAESLGNLGNLLMQANRRSEALEQVEEAVALWRGLPETERAAYGPGWASVLTSRAMLSWAAGRGGEAVAALTEAAAAFRQFPETSPIHHAGTAMVLTMHGSLLAEFGDPAGALRVLEQAVAAGRAVMGAGIEAYENVLADALIALAQCRAEAEPPHPGALAEAEEAIRLCERLAATEPDVYGPNLARALPTLALCLAQSGRTEEALATAEEAVELARRNLAEDHALTDVLLAGALLVQAKVRLLADVRLGEALTAVDEAIVLMEGRAAREPALVARGLPKAAELRDRLTARLERPE